MIMMPSAWFGDFAKKVMAKLTLPKSMLVVMTTVFFELCCHPPSAETSPSTAPPVNFANKTETEIVDQLLSHGYDPRLRPQYNEGKPTFVTCNMYIRSLNEIDQISMQYNADILFRQEWYDPRLKYKENINSSEGIQYPYLNVYNYSALWTADLYFKNARVAMYHDVIKEQKLLRVQPSGKVLYSIRVTMVLACRFMLQDYPFDSQGCYIRIGSFSQTTQHLVIAWKKKKPVQNGDLPLPEFNVTDIRTEDINAVYTTGNYSNLQVNFLLERSVSFYIIQVYVPTIMIVTVSWVSFWLDVESGPARVSLAITTFLTMHTMSSGIRSTLPPVSYTKAIDVWTGVCTAFIFAALLEYALANYVARRHLVKKRKVQEQHFMKLMPTFMKMDDDGDSWSGMAMTDLANNSNGSAKRNRRQPSCNFQLPQKSAKAVDVISRIAFPTTFLIFNIVYWVYYIGMATKKVIKGQPTF